MEVDQLEKNTIRIGGIEEADVFLPELGKTWITFYKIKDLYYLKMISSGERTVPISYNAVQLPNRMIIKFTPESRLTIASTPINLDDVRFYVKNKNMGDTRERALRFSGNEIDYCESDDEDAHLRIVVAGNIIRLTPLADLDIILRGEKLMPGQTYRVNLFDTIVVNNRIYLNVRRLILQRGEVVELKQREEIDRRYLITNYDRGSDYYITDQLDERIEVEIYEENNSFRCRVVASPATVFVDEKPVADEAPVEHHSRIRLGKTVLRWDAEQRQVEQLSTEIRDVTVRGLSFSIRDKKLIDEISFTVSAGDMACIIGPSGSGKSTLLNLLVGYYKPDQGDILYNEYDLSMHLDSLKSYIGFVPQDDLLYENLTVYENMYYRARIVNPHMEEKDVEESIDNLLLEFGLYEVKYLRVGSPLDKTLSGGQRKRLNIALEILNDPDVLYLDEPTSGLSSRDSEIIVQYLSRLSEKGKIIIATIHQPSSRIFSQFNRLILLDKGGKLAFFGSTVAGIEYFLDHSRFLVEGDECPVCAKKNPEILLSVVEEPLIDLQGRIVSRVSEEGIPIPLRKYPPDYWKRHYLRLRDKILGRECEREEVTEGEGADLAVTKPVSLWKQFSAVFSRNIKNKIKSRAFLKLILLQAPLLSLFLAWILHYRPADHPVYTIGRNHFLPYFIFLSIISILFIAFSNSIDEIVDERSVLLREKMLNIRNWIFYISKFVTLALIAVIQVVIFCVIAFPVLDIEWGLFPWYFLILFLVALNGITLGLALSASVRTSVSNIIPLILIPQIILGGALIPFEELTGSKVTPVYSHVLTSKWAYEALVLVQSRHNTYTALERWANEPSPERHERRQMLQAYWRSLQENNIKREDIVNEATEELADSAKAKLRDDNNIFLADTVNLFGSTFRSLTLDSIVLIGIVILLIAVALVNMRLMDRRL
jgi:ABC-type multidrug transport system ATPase subunit